MAVLLNLIVFIRVYIDYLIDFIYSLYYNSTRKYVPKSKNNLVLESATGLAKKIRERIVKSEDVVQAFIDRIKEVNPIVNAVTDNRFDEAILEAKQIDRAIADGKFSDKDFEEKPFLGVPFTAKESTACKGLKNTFGLLSRKDICAEEDAEAVMLLKNAGGILLGVTNVPQINLWQETSNPVFGVTNNPYNTTRNVGGSSGGEGSIIAACGSPIGIGTDIGGSIRIPCFMCGIFGHKPTCGLTSTKGLTFRKGNEGPTMVVVGPMSRYAVDLVPFMKVLAKDNLSKMKLDEKVDVKNLNIFYITESGSILHSSIRKEMKQVFMKTVNHFTEISEKKPRQLDIPNIRYGGTLWKYWMKHEPNANFNRDIANRNGEVNPYVELIKGLIRKTDFTAGTLCNFINGILPIADGVWVKQTTEELIKEITATLGDNGVLLYPSAPWPASYHHTALLRPFNFHYCAIWNALKMPATQVPLGLSSEGLPLGIQVVAAPYQDHLCIAVAIHLEKVFGGFVPPFEVNE